MANFSDLQPVVLVDEDGVPYTATGGGGGGTTGGATAANQTTGNNSLASIDDKTPALVSGAMPVSDNGGSLTVDGTVAVSGTPNVNAAQVAGTATSVNAGNADAGTQRVVIATNQSSLTVGTHAVTQSGTWNIGTVAPGTAATNLGKAEDAVHASGDVGVMALTVRNDNAATDLTSATGDYSAQAVDVKGSVFVRDRPAGTATTANVTLTTASQVALAANAARRGATLYNDSANETFVKFGTTASSTSFTVKLAAQAYYELPGWYSGVIEVIQSTASGALRVTEIS